MNLSMAKNQALAISNYFELICVKEDFVFEEGYFIGSQSALYLRDPFPFTAAISSSFSPHMSFFAHQHPTPCYDPSPPLAFSLPSIPPGHTAFDLSTTLKH